MLSPRNLRWTAVASFVALAALTTADALARVTRFVVESREPYAAGATFGTAGAFERLVGTASMEVDPGDPLNAVIVNLDKAPRNARGNVEFTSPFWIIKPLDMGAGNHKIWYAINNRGNSELLQRTGAATVPTLVAKRLELGFSLVDAGWHGDGITPAATPQLFPNFPVAKNRDGSAIVGPLRIELLPTTTAATPPPLFSRALVLGWKNYEAANTNTASATLTMRDRQDAPRTVIASNRWAFGNCPTGQASLVASTTAICLFDGFQYDKMYELIYQAKNPVVMGLAHAVTRDVGSFLRYRTQDDFGNPNPLLVPHAARHRHHDDDDDDERHGHGDDRDDDNDSRGKRSPTGIKHALGSGVSSTGMYLREWLYLGFNEDESRRRVFDGVTIYTAGVNRLFANVQFAHPTFYSRQDANQDYTSNGIAPFTLGLSHDPVSGVTDGILKRPHTDPKVMQIDGGLEMWQWKASLNVADGSGRPVKLPKNARLYYMNGASHVQTGQGLLVDGPAAGPLPGAAANVCQIGLQRGAVVTPAPGAAPIGFNHTFRALVVAMDRWASKGEDPPDSNYPRIEDGTLVPLEKFRAAFPTIPGVPTSVMQHNEITELDFGVRFDSEGGLQDLAPPRRGDSYRVFVPRADADGNDIRGVRQMEVRVPLGSNIGWNVRIAPRSPDLCGLASAYVPFAQTQAERLASGDSRLSVKERYGTQADFIAAVDRATKRLMRKGFMLAEDAVVYQNRARAVTFVP